MSDEQSELFDFLGVDQEQVNTNIAQEIGRMLRIVKAKRAEIEEKEQELKLLQEDERTLLTVTIPQTFKKEGIDHVGLEGGIEVSTSEEVACSLIKDPTRRPSAFAWLLNNGGEDLIKDFLTVEAPSVALIEMLSQHGVIYDVGKDVHPAGCEY